MMIGTTYIDAKGQDVEIPYWINCDTNNIRRKGQVLKQPGSAKILLRVRKSGCIFTFEKLGESKLVLKEVKVKIKFLPDNYQGKSMPPNLYAELAKTVDSINILRDSTDIKNHKEQLVDDKTSIMQK